MFSKKITQSHCILFLGAGASAPLGLKTTVPFLQLIPQKYYEFWKNKGSDYGNQETVAQFIMPLFQIAAKRSGTAHPDSEVVLDYIDFLLKIGNEGKGFPNEILKLSGIGSFERWIDYFTELRNFLQTLVVEHYSTVDGEQAYKLYSPLISIVCSDRNILPVFTTNYDWVFEHLVEVRQNDFKLLDGFKSIGGLGERWARDVFDRFRSSPKKTNIILLKLHGSTSWYKDNRGNIKKISEAAPQIGGSRALLIYPTQVKTDAVQEDPFKTAYEYLKVSLENTKLCIVIGFSFRDPEINKVFSIALVNNKELKLIIIDPAINQHYLDELLGKFSLDGDEFQSKVNYIKAAFGSPEAINFITEKIEAFRG